MRNPLIIERVRTISGSFAFIEHRFLRHGFWSSLSHQELLLYFFLVMVADRQGLSFYSYDKICTLLTINVDEYILARDGLLSKNLLAFDGTLFQVLSFRLNLYTKRGYSRMRKICDGKIRQPSISLFGNSRREGHDQQANGT